MKVSVLIASYNHERYIEDAIESVLGQTLQDFEIVLIDDCSQDRTFEFASRIADPRIVCARAVHNRGTSATYNDCIARARGEYVAVLNSDDFYHPDKLRQQAALLDAKREVAAVFSHAELVDEAGATRPRDRYPNTFYQPNCSRHAWLRKFFFEGNSLCHPSAMVRKEVHREVGVYDPRYGQIHDLDLWIRICLKHPIHVIQAPLTYFRLRDNSANANNASPDTLARIAWEYDHVIRRYLELSSWDDFMAVFPESTADPRSWDAAAQRNELAKMALGVPNLAHRRLALESMHDLFGELGADTVERRFGLSLGRFLRMTGELGLVKAQVVAARAH